MQTTELSVSADPRPFSLDGYAQLLTSLADAGYHFVGFENEAAEPKTVIMRHDIDFDLAQAARMAKIEAKRGIKATYFFLLRTEMYNLFSAAGTETVKSIMAMGHTIGLHFDARAYDETDAMALRSAIHMEMEILSTWFGVPMTALSFHRPAPALLEDLQGRLTAPYRHAYQSCFSKDRLYISDSQGAWRFGHPLDSEAVARGAALQILIHPLWWDDTGDAYATLEGFIEKRSAEIERQTARHCKVFRRGEYADVKD